MVSLVRAISQLMPLPTKKSTVSTAADEAEVKVKKQISLTPPLRGSRGKSPSVSPISSPLPPVDCEAKSMSEAEAQTRRRKLILDVIWMICNLRSIMKVNAQPQVATS